MTAAWQAVAEILIDIDGFNRPNCTGKTVQSRFLTLLEDHRSFNRASERKSGVSEIEDETITLLDDLLAVFDDHEKAKAKRKEDLNNQVALEECAGKTVRDHALMNLAKRPKLAKDATDQPPRKDQPSGKDAKFEQFISELKNDNERGIALRNEELQFQKYKFEMEMKERAEERNQRMALAQMEQEKMLQFMKTMLEAKK